MRDELHLMELVDRYLDGEMGAAEVAAFAQRMHGNAELQTAVEVQRALREGLVRLEMRRAVLRAHRAWVIKRWAPWVAVALVVAGVAWAMAMAPGMEGNTDGWFHEEIEGALPAESTAEADSASADSSDTLLAEATRVESVFMHTPASVRNAPLGGEESGHAVRWPEDVPTADTNVMADEAALVNASMLQEEQASIDSAAILLERSVDDANRIRQKPLLATVEVPTSATAQPRFPGGMEEMQGFIAENLKQPRGRNRSGTVTVAFTVNKKGEVVNIQVVNGLTPAYDAEAMREIGLMPEWTPCMVGDRPVKSRVEVPIRFTSKPAPRRERESAK